MSTIAVPAVKVNESDKMSDTLDLVKMSDKRLVNYAIDRQVKFALEMRAVFIEINTRFVQKRAQGRPFMGYTNWDVFCAAIFNYTGRHVNRIISGEALKKPKLIPQQTVTAKRGKSPMPDKALWTERDYVSKVMADIKETLRPLESQPKHYAGVVAAIVRAINEELTPEAPEESEEVSR